MFLCSLSALTSVSQYSSAPVSDPLLLFSIFGNRPSVINVWCVAVYVSNHNSSVKSTLPGSDRHAWAHRTRQCLLLYKADFKYSHFRGDAPQWHEAGRLNRSTALSFFLSHSLSLSALHSLSLCLDSLCFIVTRHTKSWLEYQRDNFLTVSLYLPAISLIR